MLMPKMAMLIRKATEMESNNNKKGGVQDFGEETPPPQI